MALQPKPKMTEKTLAAQARRGGLSQPWATPRVQGTARWASSPEGARHESHPSVPDRLARPFRAQALRWMVPVGPCPGLRSAIPPAPSPCPPPAA